MRQNGLATDAPPQSAISVVYRGQRVWAFFQAYGDGYSGFVPSTARYSGNGQFSPIHSSNTPTLFRVPNTDFSKLNGATGEAQLGRQTETHSVNITSGEFGGLDLSNSKKSQKRIKSSVQQPKKKDTQEDPSIAIYKKCMRDATSQFFSEMGKLNSASDYARDIIGYGAAGTVADFDQSG